MHNTNYTLLSTKNIKMKKEFMKKFILPYF